MLTSVRPGPRFCPESKQGQRKDVVMADVQGAEKLGRALVDAHSVGDWAAVKGALSPDSVYEEYGTQRRIEGSDAIVAALQGWRRAFPDVKGTVNRVTSGENTAALEITWRGTHMGPLETPNGSVPASGKPLDLQTFWVVDIQDDSVRSSRHYFDTLTILQQIGAAPA